MNYETWYQHFDEDPDEEIGRYVKGIFNKDVLVILPRVSWAYIDWMESELKGNVKEFFEGVDQVRTPEHGTIHQAYQNAIYFNFIQREKSGLSRPPWCGKATPEQLADF